MIKSFTTTFANKSLEIKIKSLAEQATSEALVRYGDTVVLVTIVMSRNPREGVNFFPLTVEYEERFYAAGKIRSSRFMKREARPSDEATITARLIDRAIRPRFETWLRNEIQVVITVLSFDQENDPDFPAFIGTSCALACSPIPWNGPLAGLRIGLKNGAILLNPKMEERSSLDLDLFIAGDGKTINMIEAGANQVSEDNFLEAIQRALPAIQDLVSFQETIVKEIGQPKIIPEQQEPDPELHNFVVSQLAGKLEAAVFETKEKTERMAALNELKEAIIQKAKESFDQEQVGSQVDQIFEQELDRLIHEKIIYEEKRPDGRKLNEFREISAVVGILPRTHGSALFSRGTTKALATLTLGPPGQAQQIESMEAEFKKQFFLHYNFPPYSVGEIGPFRGPGRREIGHGLLAERALLALIPKKEEFPYAIRVVSEILSSNGSSSMASVCAASLALMDGGVPIKAPAAGIAMGLMIDKKGAWKVLCDIQGPEDHHGDMDLKVAGTKIGITAAQMDVKIEGISLEILKTALEQAKEARLAILEEMSKVLDQPRPDLSPFAPRVFSLQIPPEKIREVIGPGGKTINTIIEETGVDIDIEDSGLVFVTAQSAEAAAKAVSWIKNITREVKPGEVFEGKVSRLFPFGAMIEILPGQEGLLHISELSKDHQKRIENLVRIGEILQVKVKEIDHAGRINLSLTGPKTYARRKPSI